MSVITDASSTCFQLRSLKTQNMSLARVLIIFFRARNYTQGGSDVISSYHIYVRLFPPWCEASCEKCLLLWHHFLSQWTRHVEMLSLLTDTARVDFLVDLHTTTDDTDTDTDDTACMLYCSDRQTDRQHSTAHHSTVACVNCRASFPAVPVVFTSCTPIQVNTYLQVICITYRLWRGYGWLADTRRRYVLRGDWQTKDGWGGGGGKCDVTRAISLCSGGSMWATISGDLQQLMRVTRAAAAAAAAAAADVGLDERRTCVSMATINKPSLYLAAIGRCTVLTSAWLTRLMPFLPLISETVQFSDAVTTDH